MRRDTFPTFAVASLKFEQLIAASPALVGAFFVPQRMAYWYGAETQSEFEVLGGASDFAIGQKISIKGKLAGRTTELTVVVTHFEFGKFLEWRFHDLYGVKGLQSWRIDSAPDGSGTLVGMIDDYQNGSWVGRALDWVFMRFAVARRDRFWLARLKSLAERSGKSG